MDELELPFGLPAASPTVTIPDLVRFGTSTWTYEGWEGQVYKRTYAKTSFPRECLGEFCQYLYKGQPLFRTVGNDSPLYRPSDDGPTLSSSIGLHLQPPISNWYWLNLASDLQNAPDYLASIASDTRALPSTSVVLGRGYFLPVSQAHAFDPLQGDPTTSRRSFTLENRDIGSTGAMQDVAHDPKAAADEAARHVGDRLESAAEHIRTLLPDSGISGQVADTLTRGVKQAATRLQEQGFGGMIDDVVGIARRYPMQALFVGLGCGYLLFRLRRD